MGDVVRLRSSQADAPAPRSAAPAPARRTPEPARDAARDPARDPAPLPPLWREAVGAEIRRARHDAGRTLGEVGGRAGISVAYLSEVERGRKEPSSEVLEAVAGALDLRLVDLTYRVTRQLAAALPARPAPASRPTGPLALAL